MAAIVVVASGLCVVDPAGDILRREEPQTLVHFIFNYPAGVPTRCMCGVENMVRALAAVDSRAAPASVLVWAVSSSRVMGDHAGLLENVRALARRARPWRQIGVHVVDIHAKALWAHTPLERFYAEPRDLGTFDKWNRVNALRLAIVHRYGGMYLDADIFIRQDVSRLADFFALQSIHSQKSLNVNSAPFQLRRPGHPFTTAAMLDFVANYNGSRWGQQGPMLWTRVIKAHCPQLSPPKGRNAILAARTHRGWCDSVTFLPAAAVGIVSWRAIRSLVTPGHLAHKALGKVLNRSKPVFVHFWDHLLRQDEERMLSGGAAGLQRYRRTALGQLRAIHCPATMRELERRATEAPAVAEHREAVAANA